MKPGKAAGCDETRSEIPKVSNEGVSADSCVLIGLVFWKDTKRFANRYDYSHTNKGDRSESIDYRGVSVLSLLESVCRSFLHVALCKVTTTTGLDIVHL